MSDDSTARRANTRSDRQALADMMRREQAPLRQPPQLLQKSRPEFGDISEPRRTPRASSASAPLPRRPARPLFGEEIERPAPRMSPLAELSADLQRAEMLRVATAPRRPYRPSAPSPSFVEQLQGRPWIIALVALISIVTIFYTSPPARKIISSYRLPGISEEPQQMLPQAPAMETAPGEHSILGQASVTADIIDGVLASYGSPAAGTGKVWVELGAKYGIDPAYALAFFIHESSAGTNPAWAGLKGDGSTTHNIGNIICAGYATCFGRFRDYASWDEGIEDWYRLIAVEYVEGRGAYTIEQIIPIYAPSFENNVPAYVQAVEGLVDQWRTGAIK